MKSFRNSLSKYIGIILSTTKSKTSLFHFGPNNSNPVTLESSLIVNIHLFFQWSRRFNVEMVLIHFLTWISISQHLVEISFLYFFKVFRVIIDFLSFAIFCSHYVDSIFYFINKILFSITSYNHHTIANIIHSLYYHPNYKINHSSRPIKLNKS